jgi:hypothetical protein
VKLSARAAPDVKITSLSVESAECLADAAQRLVEDIDLVSALLVGLLGGAAATLGFDPGAAAG